MNRSSMIQRAITTARLGGLPLLAALVTMSVQAQTTITFDEVGGSTAIDNTYAGMTFTNPLGGSIFVASTAQSKSPPNTVSLFQLGGAFNAHWGAVQVTFSTLQPWVSIDTAAARSSADGFDNATLRPFIEAYDSAGALVAKTYFQGVLPSSGGTTAWETMTVTTPTAMIKSVRFSVQTGGSGPWVYGYFDNLRLSPGILVKPCRLCR